MKTIKWIFLILLIPSAVCTFGFYYNLHFKYFLFGHLILGYPEMVISTLSMWVCASIAFICEMIISHRSINDRKEDFIIVSNDLTKQLIHIKILEKKFIDKEKDMYGCATSLKNAESIIHKLTTERDDYISVSEIRQLKIDELMSEISKLRSQATAKKKKPAKKKK